MLTFPQDQELYKVNEFYKLKEAEVRVHFYGPEMCQRIDSNTGENQNRLPDRKAEVTTYAYCSHL